MRPVLVESVQSKQSEWHDQWSMLQDDERFLFEDWIHPIRLEDFRGKDVLEGGCGGGQHTGYVAEVAASVTAVDLNTTDLARTRNERFDNVKFVEADLMNLDLGRQFDVVFSIGVIHHTDAPDTVVENLARHVKPGGKLIVWVYSDEGNFLVKNVVEPVRKTFLTALNRPRLLMLSKAVTAMIYPPVYSVYKLPLTGLPYYEYFQNFRKLSFERNTLNVFDKLNAPQVQFITESRIQSWFPSSQFEDVSITPYKGVSWRGVQRNEVRLEQPVTDAASADPIHPTLAPIGRLQRTTGWSYAVGAFLLPFVTFFKLPIGVSALQAADFFLVLAALLWGVQWLRGQAKLTLKPAVYALIAYALVGLLSGLLVSDERKAWAVHYAAMLYLGGLTVVTASLAADPKTRPYVINGWLAGLVITAVLAAVAAVLFYLGVRDRDSNPMLWGYGSIPVGNYPRIAVFFKNANMFCNYMLVGAGLLPIAWVQARSKRAKRFWLGIAGCCAVGLLFSMSSGFGGAMLGAALSWWLWKRRRARVRWWREGPVLAVGMASAVGFFVISVILFVPRGEGDLTVGPVDLQFARSGRLDTWTSSFKAFTNAPIAGVGLGTPPALVSNPRALHSMEHWGKERMKDTTPRKFEAHNIWLSVLAQMGLPGFVAFCAFCWFIFRGLLPTPQTPEPLAFVRIGLFGAVVAAVYYHGIFGSFEESRQYWCLFGIVAAAKEWS